MKKELFIKRYRRFTIPDEEIASYLSTIEAFEKYVNKDIDDASIEDIKNYSTYLISNNQNTYNNYIHIARYFYYIDKKQEYIHMTKYFNSFGVLEHIVDRITTYEGEAKKQDIVKDLTLPPFGLDSTELPNYTKKFMETMYKHVSKESCHKILAGNNHQIPAESFKQEKEYYEKADNLATYLKERHSRKVAELQEHFDQNKVWFEQVITKEAIDFVKSNQEVLSGVLKDDKLYITKIPYDLYHYLDEEDELKKRYYACHCSFVRENILSEKEDIPKEWCYCSAGFAKHPFETILDSELDISLLKTPLDGDMICRFEIDLTNVAYKK